MAYTDIDDPSAYFQTTLYTGTGSSLAVTNGGNSDLQPDLVWLKPRGITEGHFWTDSVRGVQKTIRSYRTNAEETESQGLTAFNSDGFTMGTNSDINTNTEPGVAWQWKKVAGVFDIQTYAGNSNGSRTVAHNLGVVPSLIIVKNRTNAADWFVGSTTSGVSFNWATDYFRLNEAAAKGTDSGGNLFGAVPTDSVFTPGTNNDMNGSNNNYVAYLFGNKQGVSKVGSYIGNANADGPFVYLGFKPRFVMTKRTDNTSDWVLMDSKRNPFNVMDTDLFANSTDADTTASNYSVDFLSNGWKFRGTSGGKNASGGTYIYMAFAENPFVTSTGVPATAR